MTTLTRDPFTPYQLATAEALLHDVVLADEPGVFYVPSKADSGVFYRVTVRYVGPVAREVACSCPYGRRRVSQGATYCWHATAALLHVLRAREDQQEA